MADRTPDAPPVGPTDDAPPRQPDPSGGEASAGMPTSDVPFPSEAGLRVEQARQALARGDNVGATAHSLVAVGCLLDDFEFRVRSAAASAGHGDLFDSLLRFFLDDEDVQTAPLPDVETLDRIAAARLRFRLGPAALGLGGAASAATAVLSAHANVRELLATFPEASALCRMFRATAVPPPIALGADRRYDLVEHLDSLGAGFAPLAAAFRAFPADRIARELLARFDCLGVGPLCAEMEQELALVVLEARSAAAPDSPTEPVAQEAAPAHPDGPEAPCWLWWQGVRHRIGEGRAVRGWQLLAFMWRRASATFDELQEEGGPWQEPVTSAAVATAVTRLNASLPKGYPRRLATRAYCVFWEDFQVVSAR